MILELAKMQMLRAHSELLNQNLQDGVHESLKNMALDLDMETIFYYYCLLFFFLELGIFFLKMKQNKVCLI